MENIEIELETICKKVGYSENYFIKILRNNNISNRFLLDYKDLEKLLKVPVTTNKSYIF